MQAASLPHVKEVGVHADGQSVHCVLGVPLGMFMVPVTGHSQVVQVVSATIV